jgi:radical SAM superfamily enzyme YgiQ (UPF0313 family)
LELAKEAGVSIISFGIESANPEILKFYRKKIDLNKFQNLVEYANRIGLFTVGNFIIGAPMETEETINNTFSYILNTPFDQVNLKLLDYMAGSDLYESLSNEMKKKQRHIFACKENGLNNFPLIHLKEKINCFKAKFQETSSHRLDEKIKKMGPPYYQKIF